MLRIGTTQLFHLLGVRRPHPGRYEYETLDFAECKGAVQSARALEPGLESRCIWQRCSSFHTHCCNVASRHQLRASSENSGRVKWHGIATMGKTIPAYGELCAFPSARLARSSESSCFNLLYT